MDNYFLIVSKHSRLYFAIVVVLVHCIGPSIKGAFSVFAFFFMSGYFFFYKYYDTSSKLTFWKDNMIKRLYSLLIPYIIWNTLCAIVLFFFNKELLMQKIDDNFWNLYMSGIPINGPLWFLSRLMWLVVISPIVFLLIKVLGKYSLVFFFVASILNVFYNFLDDYFLIFFCGSFCGISKIDITRIFKYRVSYIVILIFTVIFYYLSFVYCISDKLSFEFFYNIFASLLFMSVVGFCLSRYKKCCPRVLLDSSMYLYVSHMTIYYIVYPVLHTFSLEHGTRTIATPLIIALSLLSYCLLFRYSPTVLGLLMGKKTVYEKLFVPRSKKS